jgi:hypothetical protein
MGVLAIIRVTDAGASDEMVEDFSDQIVTGIKGVIGLNAEHATGRLADSIKAHAYGRQIVIESDLPYAGAVNKGVHLSKSLWSLINKVVPLKLSSGKVIFRRVTLDALLRGKWRSKPRPGMDYVTRGIRVASGSLRTRLNYVIER